MKRFRRPSRKYASKSLARVQQKTLTYDHTYYARIYVMISGGSIVVYIKYSTKNTGKRYDIRGRVRRLDFAHTGALPNHLSAVPSENRK